jgi:hypothetical protein
MFSEISHSHWNEIKLAKQIECAVYFSFTLPRSLPIHKLQSRFTFRVWVKHSGSRSWADDAETFAVAWQASDFNGGISNVAPVLSRSFTNAFSMFSVSNGIHYPKSCHVFVNVLFGTIHQGIFIWIYGTSYRIRR